MNPISITDATLYRLVIADPETGAVCVEARSERPRFPEVWVSRGGRLAWELQRSCREVLHLHVLVIRLLPAEDAAQTRCVLAELLERSIGPRWRFLPLQRLGETLCSSPDGLTNALADHVGDMFGRVGWIDPVISWVEAVTKQKIVSKAEIEQFNAGIGFSLLRLPMADGSNVWFKAAGPPNRHEFQITEYLSVRNGQSAPYVPRLLGIRKDWNAWLMAGDGTELPTIPSNAEGALPVLSDAIVSLARLQIATLPDVNRLLKLGAFDQSLLQLNGAAPALFDYLKDAMDRQTSTRAPRLESCRIEEIRSVFEDSCRQLLSLDLPTSLLHGDLNRGNILWGKPCLFLDWSETYVGIAFVAMQHLLLLNRIDCPDTHKMLHDRLTGIYCEEWSRVCARKTLDAALVHMPLLAAFSALYGRGEWFLATDCESLHRSAYARTLARRMDRAARVIEKGDNR